MKKAALFLIALAGWLAVGWLLLELRWAKRDRDRYWKERCDAIDRAHTRAVDRVQWSLVLGRLAKEIRECS